MTGAVEQAERFRRRFFTASSNKRLRAELVAAALSLGWQPLRTGPVDTLPPGAQPRFPVSPRREPDPQIFSTPPIIERPLGVDEGSTVQVREFPLAAGTEHPKQGITNETLPAILERRRQAPPVPKALASAGHRWRHHPILPRDRIHSGPGLCAGAAGQHRRVVTIEVMEGALGQVRRAGSRRLDMATPHQRRGPEPRLRSQ